MKNNNKSLLLCTILILAVALLRIANVEFGWYHFAPIVAMSLFAGAKLKRNAVAFILPLAAFLLSDIYMQVVHHNGFYGIAQSFVYGAMIAIVLLGSMMKKQNWLNILGFSVGGTLLFWVISNLGVFAGGYYGYSFTGFIQTYVMALPFYKDETATTLFVNGLLGDILFNGALFGAYALLAKSMNSKRQLAK